MQTQTINIDRAQARELWRKYKSHLHYSTPVDDAIRRTYQKIAQGRTVIKALESITAAGLNEQGFPKLAIARASAKECVLDLRQDGSATMCADDSGWSTCSLRGMSRQSRNMFRFGPGAFHASRNVWSARAMLPIVPVHLRPKRGLDNYHILWEAEWTKIVPRDPLLLRRIGRADLWLVVAAWDLTEVERAALAVRL